MIDMKKILLVGCVVWMLLVSGCGNKDMAMQIMSGIKANPPVKSISVSKSGATKTEYFDTTQMQMQIANVLMKNDALEWFKAGAPIIVGVGGTWVSKHYDTKQSKYQWKGIEGIAGDRYSVDGGSSILQGGSQFDSSAFTLAE